MDGAAEFESFINRIRAGDSSAAEELVKRYEPLVRREVRMQMVDSRLARIYDSTDFSQAVMASFFLRAGEGDYELNDPTDLVRLLVSMARNKLASSARKILSKKRDGQRVDMENFSMEQVADTSESPSRLVSMTELIEKARSAMSAEEQKLAAMRNDGMSWAEIAAAMGGTPQSRRMQLARALDRVTESLGMDGP